MWRRGSEKEVLMAAASPPSPRAAGRRDWRSTALGLMVLCAFILALTPSAQAARAARHGGTIMATWGASLSTVDPAYTYSYVDWPQTHALFDGLLGFSTGTTLVPHMATAMPDL